MTFKRLTGGSCHLYAKYYDAVSGWQAEELLAEYIGGYCIGERPRVAMSAGHAVVVWQAVSATGFDQVWAAINNGAGWTVEQLAHATENSPFPQVAMDTSGNAMAVWVDAAGSSYRQYLAVSGWQPAAPVTTSTAAEFRLRMNTAGNALLIWLDGSPLGPVISAKYFDGAGGAWSDSMNVAPASQTGGTMDLALNNADEAIAVWSKSTDSDRHVSFNTFAAGQGWAGAQDIAAEISATHIVLRMNDVGDALAVWLQNLGGSNQTLDGASYNKVGGWSYQEISTDTALMTPALGMDANGNGLVVWQSKLAPSSITGKTLSTQYQAGSGWSASPSLNSGNALQPLAAVNDNGAIIAVWEQASDATGANIALWAATGDTSNASNKPVGGTSGGNSGGGLFGPWYLLLLTGAILVRRRAKHRRANNQSLQINIISSNGLYKSDTYRTTRVNTRQRGKFCTHGYAGERQR